MDSSSSASRQHGSSTGTEDSFPKYKDGDVLFHLAPTQTYQLHAGILRQHSALLRDMLRDGSAARLSSGAKREGVTTLYRIDLLTPAECKNRPNPLPDHGGVGNLRLRQLDHRARLTGTTQLDITRSLDAGQVTNTLYTHYDNVLRALYNLPINIATSSSTDTAMGSIVSDILGLTSVAEYLDCMKVVTYQIDNALVRQGQVLWVSVAANPGAWADLAVRIQSELVFREAICHLVGRWPRLTFLASRVDDTYPGGKAALAIDQEYCYAAGLPKPHGVPPPDEGTARLGVVITEDEVQKAHRTIANLRPEVRTLIQRKHRELIDLKTAVNLRLMGFYPTFFARPGGPNSLLPDCFNIGQAIEYMGVKFRSDFDLPAANPNHMSGVNVGKGSKTVRNMGTTTRTATTYAKDVLGWMALTLFRHWFGQYVVSLPDQEANVDGGWVVYDAIARGGEAYLDYPAIESFCCWFPVSSKGRTDFEAQMTKIKEELKVYPADLVANRLTLDLSKGAEVVKASARSLEELFGKNSGVAGERGQLKLQYLVCTQVSGGELPWKLTKDSVAAAVQAEQRPLRRTLDPGKNPHIPLPIPPFATGRKRERYLVAPPARPDKRTGSSDDDTPLSQKANKRRKVSDQGPGASNQDGDESAGGSRPAGSPTGSEIEVNNASAVAPDSHAGGKGAQRSGKAKQRVSGHREQASDGRSSRSENAGNEDAIFVSPSRSEFDD